MTLAFPFLVVLRNRVKVTQHTLIKKRNSSFFLPLCVWSLLSESSWLRFWSLFLQVSYFSDVWQLNFQQQQQVKTFSIFTFHYPIQQGNLASSFIMCGATFKNPKATNFIYYWISVFKNYIICRILVKRCSNDVVAFWIFCQFFDELNGLIFSGEIVS